MSGLPAGAGQADRAETRNYYAASKQIFKRLADWKARFNIPARLEGESLLDYRSRVGIVVYYNQNELGLGREVGCSTFLDGSQGEEGVACCVTNYGQAFQDLDRALADAIEGRRSRNTVCISYQPSLGAGNGVQFGVFGRHEGRLKVATKVEAELDALGHRTVPHICTSCHGGTYDSNIHLAKDARFLPLNAGTFRYSDSPGYTLADQSERIRRINDLIARVPASTTTTTTTPPTLTPPPQ